MNDWWIIFGKIHPWNLTVDTSNQSGSEFLISLNFEYPLALDTASILWNLTSFYFSPYFVVVHISVFLGNSLPPQLSLNGTKMVPYFLKVLWFLVFLTDLRNFFAHALKVSD